jgi:L-alanine-DL-glutamate epimerase-like enolase superfamily enzyme
MKISLKKYNLPLKHVFGISRERYASQDTLIVDLQIGDNHGYGEATSNPYYNITVEGMMEEINTHRTQIESYAFEHPADFHAFLSTLELSMFTLCALDLAAHDLYGKLLKKPLYEIWGASNQKYPITNYTIGIDDISVMVNKMKEKPWPIYKIKLGTSQDVEIVKTLRKYTDAVFRVDANCAWTAKETLDNAPKLKALGVEFIEQPLAADDFEGLNMIKHNGILPIIADESCIVENDVEKCALYYDGINIKLTKCGGLTPALRMIARARELNLKVMVGCMTESTVGISAIAQLTPQLDYVDMDGAMLLKKDIASGIKILHNGTLVFPAKGGSGISMIA